MLLAESLDLHVDSRGEIEPHQSVDGLRGRLENVQQALVGSHLEMLTRFLVHVGRAKNAVAVLDRGQRDRPSDARAGALGGLHDLTRLLVEDPVVVSLEPDPDLLVEHHCQLPKRNHRGTEITEGRSEGGGSKAPRVSNILHVRAHCVSQSSFSVFSVSLW